MMRFHNIRPVLVFDGGYLPSKQTKETERREKRNEYRQRGKRFLSEGERSRAIDAFQKCIDVTPEMALNVMQVQYWEYHIRVHSVNICIFSCPICSEFHYRNNSNI
jgi:5'-3' exonuclease